MSLLQVQGLSVEFATTHGRVHAVRDLSFTLDKGTILGVVGESGSGKTVAALSLMRLLGDNARSTRGVIRFDGRDLLALSEPEVQRLRGNRIAMIFQDPMTALNPVERISRQVADAVRYHRRGLTRREIRARVLDALDSVGVPDVARRADQYPHQWSGGMRQRAMIAMALINEPDLLIADEPTTALDATVQAQVLDLIARIRAERGCAVLFISHDLAVVQDLADEVMVMYAGAVAERATATTLFADPRHPYTRALIRSSPGWATRRARLHTISGRPPDLVDPPNACNFAPRCTESAGLALCLSRTPSLEQVAAGHDCACHRQDQLPRMEVFDDR